MLREELLGLVVEAIPNVKRWRDSRDHDLSMRMGQLLCLLHADCGFSTEDVNRGLGYSEIKVLVSYPYPNSFKCVGCGEEQEFSQATFYIPKGESI